MLGSGCIVLADHYIPLFLYCRFKRSKKKNVVGSKHIQVICSL